MIKMIKEYFKNFYTCYGVLGPVAAVAVFLKTALFYFFIGTVTNVVPVLAVSCILIYLLFSSFKNKWIPAGVFAALSVLMLCNVLYSTFFNRYLSVNMLAAVGLLGDITASIWEVFRVSFLLLFVDVIIVFACLIWQRKISKSQKEEINIEDDFFTAFEAEVEAEPEPVQGPVIANRRKRNSKGKNSILKWFILHAKQLTAGLIILLLIVNVTGSNLIKSISNQEIITYHIKDIAYKAFAITGEDGLTAFRDTYRHEKDGPFFGIAEGRNLIVIQLESFQNFLIGMEHNGQELTPNINRLLEENTAYFENFYQQIGSGNTSDAEFAVNNAIMGSIMSYTNKLYGGRNYFRGLPAMLRDKGYDTAVFHAFERKTYWSRDIAFPNWGFNRFYGGLNDRPGDGVYTMKEWMGWGLTDTHFYEQTLDLMEELNEPFYSFVISLSHHHPYLMLDHYRFIELLPEYENTIVGNYLQSAAYMDYALGQFLDGLKERGWYDNSVIALYGDHLGLPRSDNEISGSMERLLGRPYDFDVMMNVGLIITVPNSEIDIRQTISTAGGHMDFFPTIAYLMGFERLDTLYLGHNLFAITEGLVAQQTHMTKGSFFKNDIAFEMSRDGVFQNGRAWNLRTGERIPVSEVYDYYVRAMDIINTSEYILRSDAIRRIFIDGEDARTAFSLNVARTHPHTITQAGAPGEHANSVEAIQYSHGNDARCIRIELGWTEKIEGEDPWPIAISSTGEIEMTHEELIHWMQAHADTNIVVSIEKSGDFFMRRMSELSPAIAERLILELPELYEYTGKHDAIINISNVSQSVPDIRAFIEKNNVWAVVMTQEDAEGRFAGLLDLNTGIYIIGEADGLITKTD